MDTQALINRTERPLMNMQHGAQAYAAVQMDADSAQFGRDTTDAEFERGQRFAELKYELASDMRAALIGLQSFVPTYTRTADGIRRERPGVVMQEVLETLEHLDCGHAFADILKRSQCPMVVALRDLIVNRYVAETAEGLADARGL